MRTSVGFDRIIRERSGKRSESTVQAFQEIEYSVSELNSGGSQVLKASHEINNVTSSIRSGSAEIKAGIQTMMESADQTERHLRGGFAGEAAARSAEILRRDQGFHRTEVVAISTVSSGRIVELLKTEFGKFRT